ncbi:C-Jun-amino-terminal kinase-interacting protein 4 [Copidosoma floridanum]|uniref:C-Jun-amino-terminal kinase-interacting protein 4 n=1 Tax=Copidosoma floridanum TaxID=29053 RepID=UPI0006C9BA2D|nr:C-Jun-amino-terminal kinase-interacting protein 4 [Copidosoma floridanum]
MYYLLSYDAHKKTKLFALDSLNNRSSEKLVARRANERREQYRQVRAHVRKEDGRMQAYGWSLPGKPSAPSKQPVPVPVYCRPLEASQAEPGMKIWCGAGVNLSGGKTRDGGSMIGGSVFYAAEARETGSDGKPEDAIEHLDKELQDSEQRRLEAEKMEQQLSSLVWICTSTPKMSKVTVIDANNPADVLEVFNVCQSHLLCIASVPGAKESDYVQTVQDLREDEQINREAIDTQAEVAISHDVEPVDADVKIAKESQSGDNSPGDQPREMAADSNTTAVAVEPPSIDVDTEAINLGKVRFVKIAPESDSPQVISTKNSNNGDDDNDNDDDDDDDDDDNNNDDDNDDESNEKESETLIEKMSSVQPTMWLGAQDGSVFVHSAVAKWSVCLHTVKLQDAALSVVHIQGRVLVALADGTVAIFRRGMDGEWDLSQYHIITLGSPQHSIRCMSVVLGKTVWCGYRNKIHVIDPISMKLECTVDAHPRRESQVRQLAWLGDGVWVSIRLDSTLRLYHAHTLQHLQDVDIEPYVSKMLGTGKLGFSFVRITALLISSNRMWIGTGNGVIISVPLSESAGGSMAVSRIQTGSGKGDAPGLGVRVYASEQNVVPPGNYVPYCSMAHAQLSFHGHRDAVKMFVAVPDTFVGHGGQSAASDNTQPAMLVLSGGEGYIDFRVGDGEETEDGIDRTSASVASNSEEQGEQSHLIVWQVQCSIPAVNA